MPGTMSLIYLLWSLFLLHSAVARPNGLTLKLIHRDSIDSPLYPGNLTTEQRFQRLNHHSKARNLQLLSMIIRTNNQTSNPDLVRPPVAFEGSYYMALVGIGTIDAPPPTPSYKSYYLIVDTGSDLIWTQCEGCKAFKCFAQKEPLFPNTKSLTYRPLPCDNHPLCDRGKCIGAACSFEQIYHSESSTHGILATEKFTFHSDSGGTETMDVVFGCALFNQKFDFIEGAGGEIAGIFGLGGGVRSFLNQLGPIGQGRFSHCLQPWTHGPASSTFLRFGQDAQIGGGAVRTTPLIRSSFPTIYYLDLQDISVQGKRIGFAPGTFALRNDGSGGCAIDSGSPFTVISVKAYDRVRRAVEDYFSGFNVPMIPGGLHGFDLCYSRPDGFDNMPSFTFHFQSADLEVGREASFLFNDEYMCMTINPLNYDLTVLGAYQQTNYRFLYDVDKYQLSFAKEDCTIGA